MRQPIPSSRVVFVLQHEHELPSGEDDVKMIGVYSSAESAEAARDRLRLQPGFKEFSDGFTIARYELDVDHWTEGYITLQPEDIQRQPRPRSSGSS